MPLLNRNFLICATAAAAMAVPVFGQAPAPAPAPGGAQQGGLDSLAIKKSQLKNGALQYFEGGKYKEAIAKAMEYLALLSPPEKTLETEKVTYLLLAECYYRLGGEENLAKAIGFWNEYIRIWPNDPMIVQVKSALAGGYMKLKDWQKAIETWVQVENLGRDLESPKNDDQTRTSGRAYKENALDGQAFCYRQTKDPEEEIKVLERLVYPDFFTPVAAEGAVRLMSLYALKHDPADPDTIKFADKAVELLKTLQGKTHLIENFIALNSIAIKLGDELLDVHAYTKALDAYWAVRPRDVVAKMQRDRIKAIELRADQLLAAAKNDPKQTMRANDIINEVIKPRLVESKKILAEYERVPDFMPSLYFRLARCQADLNKKWEAIVVFNQILEDYPNSPVRELVMFSRLALYVDLNVAERAYTYCDEYLKEYATGPHAAEVLYLRGIASMRKKDWYLGEKNFEEAVKQLGDLPDRTGTWARTSTDPNIRKKATELQQQAEDHKKLYWTQCRYQLANARFLQNKFDVAQQDFNAFISEFGNVADGKGEFMEDAEYQLALCHLFQGHYQKDPAVNGGEDGAIERLQGYLKKWGGQSTYGSDAKYRLAICRYAAYESELCVQECTEWLKDYGDKKDEILQPEVYALLGDAKAALKEYEDSAKAYIESYKRATTDEVLNYSLFEAGKQLQKAGNWEAVDKLYTEFVKNRPEHPAAVTAIYWMGKAKYKLGNLEEAKKITIEALQKHIANPKVEGVEMMLSQMAEWARRRPQSKLAPPPAAPPAPAAPSLPPSVAGATVPAAAPKLLPAVGQGPEPAKWDAEAELTKMLQPLAENPSPTAQARLDYAHGELYRIGRTPEKRVEIIGAIAGKYKPEDLSPHLLMETGDYFMAHDDVAKAEAAYRRLREDFPKSERVDAGWVGLGDVNFAKQDYQKALELYTYAIDRLGAPWKLKEALIGQARCWMEFARVQAEKNPAKAADLWEKARKQFEEVASVREWRGESTALALYYLAEIKYQQGKFVDATSSFERLTDTQSKYPRWVARGFLRAAEGYYRQGKNEMAQKTLIKLLDPREADGKPDARKADKFKGLPELDQAKKRLTELGGTV